MIVIARERENRQGAKSANEGRERVGAHADQRRLLHWRPWRLGGSSLIHWLSFLAAALVFLLTAQARAQPADAGAPASDDAEIEVPKTPSAPSLSAPDASGPLVPPETATANDGGVKDVDATAATAPTDVARGSVSDVAGLPRSTAPVGKTDAPSSLVAEGSNYVRPIRRGLTWWGFVQAQYERNQISEDQLAPGGSPLNQDQFLLRRGRLRLDRGWDNAAATLELDATTLKGFRITPRRAEASILLRASEDDHVTPLLVMSGGITDLPFGAEIGESQRDRVFMERSLGSLALFPSEADIGLKLWGAYRFLNYALAVVNGQPLTNDALPRDPNEAKDIVGRVGTRIASLEAGLSFYRGKGFSPGRDVTKDSLTWLDDNNNGFAEPHEIQGLTGSAPILSQSFQRWALGLDLGGSLRTRLGVSRLYGELTLASNMDRALLVSDPVLAGSDIRQVVLALGAVQQITDYGFIGFRAAYYDPNSDVLEQRAGIFHIKDQSFSVWSPAIGLTLPHGRLVGQYDFVVDHLGRDDRGVPTNAKNDQLTIRLQVDL